MPIRDILLAIAIFVNGAKGHSALQLSRDLDCQYKTAFVLAHKIREAITADCDERTLAGEVEVDGAYFGGYVKPANEKANRIDRRKAEHQTGKRKVVVVMRERGGETLPFVFRSEAASVSTIGRKVAPARPSTPTKPPRGIACTIASSRSASTIRKPIRRPKPAPTAPSRSSPASAGPRSASTITSPAPTSKPTARRWRGARITAGCPTASSTS